MTERPNIRRMQMPESDRREKLAFDPERDITVNDWRKIQIAYNKVIDSKESGERMQIPYYLLPLAILRPDHPSLRNADGNRVKLRVDLARGINDWRRFLVSASANAILGHAATIDNLDRADINQYIDGLRRGGVADFLSSALAQAHIFDPQSTFPLGQNDEKQMRERLEVNRESLGTIDYAVDVAANMRILGLSFPSFAHPEWYAGRDILNAHRSNGNWKDFLQLAASMKILAAKKINVPPQGGLEITMPERDKEASDTPREPESLRLE